MTEPCDDREIMRIWRECGLPEYFLGNGGSNHKLVAFADRLRAELREEMTWLKAELRGVEDNRFYDMRDAYFEGRRDAR